jgi:hypothetical protein
MDLKEQEHGGKALLHARIPRDIFGMLEPSILRNRNVRELGGDVSFGGA